MQLPRGTAVGVRYNSATVTGIAVRNLDDGHYVNHDGTDENGDPTTYVTLDWDYEVYPAAVRLLPEEPDTSPYLDEVLVVGVESDALALTEVDSDHVYGWRRDGDRSM